MNRTKGVIAAALLFAGMSLFARDAHRAFWCVANVQTGRYDVAENWVEAATSTTPWGAVPANGFWGCFDSTSYAGKDYALAFPEPLWENSHTQVRGIGGGGSVTFDSRDSFWFKSPGYNAANNAEVSSSYKRSLPFIFAEGGTEGIWWARLYTAQTPTSTTSGFMLTNGLMRLSRSTDGKTMRFDLDQGELNWRDPLGSNTVSDASLQFGYNAQDQDVTTLAHAYAYSVAEGASLRGKNLDVFRGDLNVAGTVDLSGTLAVGANNTAGKPANAAAAMGVTNGVVNVAGTLKVGDIAKDAGIAPSALAVGGSAKISATSLTVSTRKDAAGVIRVGGTATVTVDSFKAGSVASSDVHAEDFLADVSFSDQSTFVANSSIILGAAANANGRLTFSGSATAAYRNNHSLYLGQGGHGELVLDGNAVFTNSGPTYVCNGSGTGTKGSLVLKGNAAYRLAVLGSDSGNNRQVYIGYYDASARKTARSRARLTVSENATFSAPNNALHLFGTDSLITLAGGTTTFYRGNLFGGTGDKSGVVVSGGTHTFSQESYVGGNNSGYQGHNAYLRQEGGTLSIPNGLRVADYGSTGRVELVGGVYSGPITSAGDADARAEFYANGGTYAPKATYAGNQLSGLDDVRVGARGLTFQMKTYSIPVEMEFQDAADAPGEGLVKIIGTTASATLTANASATHAKTRVETATLLPGASCATFGKTIFLTAGGVLSLAGDKTSFEAESIEFGSADGKGALKIDVGDVVTLTGAHPLEVWDGAIVFASAPANGTYGVLRCTQGVDDPTAALNLKVEGIGASQRAGVKLVADGTDTLVQVVVYSDADERNNTWKGTSADWDSSANWTEGVPGVADRLLFADDAGSKSVSLPYGVTLVGLTFADSYALGGEGAIRLRSIETTAGESSVDVPLSVSEDLTLTVARGSSLDLSEPLKGAGTVTKDGSGELDVNAENDEFFGSWKLLLGRTVFETIASVGGESSGATLTLGPGTVQFNDGGTRTRDVVVAAGTDKAAIVDCRADVTFDGSYNATSGGFVKIGPGALSFNVTDTAAVTRNPSKTYLAYCNSNGGEYYPSKFSTEDTVFDPCGDFGTMTNSLGGFNVLDGRMTITGSGKDLTKYQQNYWTVIGGRYPAQQAEAELELRNLSWNNNSNYRRMAIGAGTCEGCPQHPTLRILDGSDVNVDGLFLGMKGNAGECYPTLSVTNSTVSYRHLHLGENAVCANNHPTMRLGAGAVVSCFATGTDETKGLWIRDNTDVIVSDGGVLAAGSGAAAFIVDQYASGRLRFENGGTLKTPRLRGANGHNASVSNLVFQFDAGILQFVKPDWGLEYSVMVQPAYHSIEAAAGGLEIRTDESVSHTLAIPVTGPGKMRKTGLGELVLAEGCRGTAASHPTLTGLTTADWQGGTEVAEGVLTLQDGCVTNTAMSFAIAAGAALNLNGDTFQLGTISGGGVVSNGTLTCGLSVPWNEPSDAVPMFDHVKGVVTVDFNAPQGATGFPKENIVVARLAPGTAFTGIRWKGVNKGKGIKATFAVEDGVVMAKLDFSGVLLIVR